MYAARRGMPTHRKDGAGSASARAGRSRAEESGRRRGVRTAAGRTSGAITATKPHAPGIVDSGVLPRGMESPCQVAPRCPSRRPGERPRGSRPHRCGLAGMDASDVLSVLSPALSPCAACSWPDEGGAPVNLALLGGLDRRPLGPGWTKEALVAIFGGGEVDLTESPPEGAGESRAVALLGAVRLIVPGGHRGLHERCEHPRRAYRRRGRGRRARDPRARDRRPRRPRGARAEAPSAVADRVRRFSVRPPAPTASVRYDDMRRTASGHRGRGADGGRDRGGEAARSRGSRGWESARRTPELPSARDGRPARSGTASGPVATGSSFGQTPTLQKEQSGRWGWPLGGGKNWGGWVAQVVGSSASTLVPRSSESRARPSRASSGRARPWRSSFAYTCARWCPRLAPSGRAAPRSRPTSALRRQPGDLPLAGGRRGHEVQPGRTMTPGIRSSTFATTLARSALGRLGRRDCGRLRPSLGRAKERVGGAGSGARPRRRSPARLETWSAPCARSARPASFVGTDRSES